MLYNIEYDLSEECLETEFLPTSLRQSESKSESNQESNNKQTTLCVRGRLKKHLPFWKTIGASKFILDIIESGYKIPFFGTPTPFKGKNNASSRLHASFVNDAVNDLLSQNCIQQIKHCPQIINPLSVSIQSSGKKRLILDLRHVNQFVYKQKFKCEDIKTILQLIDKDFYLFKFDLKSAYHHIEIHEEHRQYLSFAWDFGDSVLRYFHFCVLPFGLSSAPFIFTKLMKPLTKCWRTQGIPIAVYLDDGLGAGKSSIVAKRHALIVHSDLLKAGFIVNAEPKSVWDPSQTITWLGYTINTKDNIIQATDKRIKKLQNALGDILKPNLDPVLVKQLASVRCGTNNREFKIYDAAGSTTRFGNKEICQARQKL